jgi:hypothetical protein
VPFLFPVSNKVGDHPCAKPFRAQRFIRKSSGPCDIVLVTSALGSPTLSLDLFLLPLPWLYHHAGSFPALKTSSFALIACTHCGWSSH